MSSIVSAPPPAAHPPLAAWKRPAWMRTRVFRFFSSVRLAVVLLSVLIVASAVGTVYESTFDAKVARYYIYEARWFNLWLLLLGANLTCSALSRLPWKRRHVGFLVTHLGIIVLLLGALIGRLTGIEGTMTLFKGQPPNNQLVIDQHVLRIEENGRALRPIPVSIIGRKPTAEKPWLVGQTPAGWNIELTDYAPTLDAEFTPQPVGAGGAPAIFARLVSKRLKQTIESWLLVDDAEHNSLDLGLASVQLRRGAAPAIAPAQSTAQSVDESQVVFAGQSGAIVQAAPGTVASGAAIRLEADATHRRVSISAGGLSWDIDLDAAGRQPQELGGSGLRATIDGYWPDFIMRDGKPATASAEPRRPAAIIHLEGSIAAAQTPAPRNNVATLYCNDAGALTFRLETSASPDPIVGSLSVGQPINTGWADWQLEVSRVMPHSIAETIFHPVRTETTDAGPGAAVSNKTEGVRVRLTRGGQSHEDWAALGWNFAAPTGPKPTVVSYGFLVEPLPVGLQLTDFQVARDEGSDSPAGFKSTLKLTDMDGATDAGSCSMNVPYNYPGRWWNTFSGLTFKVSQASWNPDNLNQSTVQILRDPGWLLKWIGSLLVVAGIFTLFYLRPAPKARDATL